MSEADRGARPRWADPTVVAGLALLSAALVGLTLANSPLRGPWIGFWATELSLDFGDFGTARSLHDWVNEGLMAIFFLYVGVQVKDEVVNGVLSSRRRATLPVAMALGGIAVPVGIFLGMTWGGPAQQGWGTVMATDIVFALLVLRFVPGVPRALKLLLLATATVDDIAASAALAIFFTSDFAWRPAVGAVVLLTLLALLNRFHLHHPFYLVVAGVALWGLFMAAGIQGPLAGVALAIMIPSHQEPLPPDAVGHTLHWMRRTTDAPDHRRRPLKHVEQGLVPWVEFLILPVFALANTDVHLLALGADVWSEPVLWAVAAGLVIGKPVGIFGAAWITVRLGLAKLPEDVHLRALAGLGIASGVGFTLSLFFAEVALDDDVLSAAKASVLGASLIAGVAGWMVLRWAVGKRGST